jgi:hypothetical protein
MTKPTLAVQTEAGRKYVHPVTDEEVYSVTTIINGGIPKKLEDWAAREAAKYAVQNWHELTLKPEIERLALISRAHERTRQVAADKGDEVHDSAENYTKGQPDGKSLKHMTQLKNFFEVTGFEPMFQEVSIWNRSIGYAGTADLIAFDHKRDMIVLIDYKTGRGIWPEMAIQVEALARGEFIIEPDGTEIPMPCVDEVGVLHLRPQSWWYHPVTTPEATERNWSAFLGAKQVSDWKRWHPDMIWGTTDRYNAYNWPQAA